MNYTITSKTSTMFSIESDLHNSSYLGVVFSGIGYTYRNPLLYYSGKVLKELELDYIGIDYRYYDDLTFFNLTDFEKDKRWEEDNKSVVQSIIDIENQYDGFVLIGKSMGTSVIRRCLKETKINKKAICILITPGNEWKDISSELMDSEIKTLVIASKEDSYYAKGNNEGLKIKKNIDVFELEKGNHSLEINNIELDIDNLKRVIIREKEFIKSNIIEFG